MIAERSANLATEGSIARFGQLRDGRGELGLDTSADVDESGVLRVD